MVWHAYVYAQQLMKHCTISCHAYMYAHQKYIFTLCKVFLACICIYMATYKTLYCKLPCIYVSMPKIGLQPFALKVSTTLWIKIHVKLGFKSVGRIFPVYIGVRYHIYEVFNYVFITIWTLLYIPTDKSYCFCSRSKINGYLHERCSTLFLA